nr:MAG TPA: hypothetical protein [Caudoviricetes sp.]DAX49410.1 MAG TPA: hypothetical protein [Caudoviricetes sp.]
MGSQGFRVYFLPFIDVYRRTSSHSAERREGECHIFYSLSVSLYREE